MYGIIKPYQQRSYKMKVEYQNYHIRMDKELHQKLKQVAKDNRRTLSDQIHLMLYAQLKDRKQ